MKYKSSDKIIQASAGIVFVPATSVVVEVDAIGAVTGDAAGVEVVDRGVGGATNPFETPFETGA